MISIIVRIHDFGNYPADINCDESLAAVEAMALLQNGTDHHGTPYPVYFEAWGNAQMNVLYSYILIPFIRILGISTSVVRLPMLLFSLLGIAILTWIARKLFSKEVALLVLAFAAINPWHIMASRWALESNLFPQFLMISAGFLCLSIFRKKIIPLCLAFFFHGISLYAYGVAYFYIAFLLLGILILLYQAKTFTFCQLAAAVFCFLLSAWPILLMVIINLFHLPGFTIAGLSIQFYEKTTRTSDILIFSEPFWPQFRSNLSQIWDLLVLQKMDLWWNQLPSVGTLYKISLPFTLIGLALLIRAAFRSGGNSAEPKTLCLRILLIGVLASLFTGLMINDANVTRMNHIYYPLIFATAYGIYWIFTRSKPVGIVVSAAFGAYFVFFCFRYFYSEDRAMINHTYDKGLEKALRQVESIPGDLCISTRQYRDHFPIAEANVLYLLRLPYGYYSGAMTADEITEIGFEKPYAEQFHYFSDPADGLALYGEDCAYVVNRKDRELFDPDAFTVRTFDDFSIALPHPDGKGL